MRVLHLWDTYTPTLFDRSHPICLQEGIESSVVCMHFVNTGTAPFPNINYIRRIAPDSPAPSGVIARALRKLHRKNDAFFFRRLVRNHIRWWQPDVIHLHFGTTAALLSSVEEIFTKRVIISFYGFDISQALQISAIKNRYKKILQRKPLVHVLCSDARKRVIALGGTAENILVANLPINLDAYPNIGIRSPEINNWLIPARFVEKKGHGILFQAFKIFLRDHPNARLTCWGYGPKAWLENLANSLGLSSYVQVIDNHLTDDFDNAYIDILKAHDVILVPSITSSKGDDEGGPALTAVMAQAAGKPVITSDFPGSERSVANGIEGIVIPQNNIQALVDAMEKITANPVEAARMGQAGRMRVLKEFSLDAYKKFLLNCYRQPKS